MAKHVGSEKSAELGTVPMGYPRNLQSLSLPSKGLYAHQWCQWYHPMLPPNHNSKSQVNEVHISLSQLHGSGHSQALLPNVLPSWQNLGTNLSQKQKAVETPSTVVFQGRWPKDRSKARPCMNLQKLAYSGLILDSLSSTKCNVDNVKENSQRFRYVLNQP